jgi:hypothetical protein
VFSPCWARNSLLGPIPQQVSPAGNSCGRNSLLGPEFLAGPDSLLGPACWPAACLPAAAGPLAAALAAQCGTVWLLDDDAASAARRGERSSAGAWAEGSRRCSMVDGAAAGGAQASLPVALVGSLEQYPYAKGEPGAKFLELNKVTLTPTQHIVFGFAWLLTVRHCHCVNRATACRCVKGVADGERPPSRALPSAAAITATTTATTAVHAHELPPATVQMRRCTSTCRSAATTIRSGRP